MENENLKKLGLSDKEIAVFLCVLQNSKIAPALVSSITKINRPTVYSVAKELIGKGLIAEDSAGPTKYLVSLGEKAVFNLLKSKEREIEKTKEILPEIVKELSKLPKNGSYSVPRMRFVDEERMADFLLEQSEVWAKSGEMSDKTWWGFQDHTLLERYKDWADHFWKKFPGYFRLKLLTNQMPIETDVMKKEDYAFQRQVKFLKNSSEFTMTQAVIGDYVLMICLLYTSDAADE